MAEIHVPKKAESILTVIINLAQEVEADNDYSRDLGAIDLDEARHFQQKFDDLKTRIETLGFKWCDVDPFEYNCKADDYYPQSRDLLFFKDNDHLPQDAIEFRVPYEIYLIISKYNLPDEPINNYEFPTEVRQLLSKLREKVRVRSGLEAVFSNSNSDSTNKAEQKFRLSENNRTAYLNDVEYVLNEKEGAVIRHLYEKSNEGFPNVEKHTLIDIGCGKQSKIAEIRNIFSERDTYKAFIKYVGKGIYRLNI